MKYTKAQRAAQLTTIVTLALIALVIAAAMTITFSPSTERSSFGGSFAKEHGQPFSHGGKWHGNPFPH